MSAFCPYTKNDKPQELPSEAVLGACFCWASVAGTGSNDESSVHGKQPGQKEKIMKKTASRKSRGASEMRREYRFDYRKARPNRFASLMKGGSVAVVLDPDVASVFRSPESVNSLLRSVIAAFPKRTKAQQKSA